LVLLLDTSSMGHYYFAYAILPLNLAVPLSSRRRYPTLSVPNLQQPGRPRIGEFTMRTGWPDLLLHADEIHAAITPAGTWQWCTKDAKATRHRAQSNQYRQYTKKRDMKRIYTNAPTRWSKYSAPMMAKLTKITTLSPRQVERRTKRIYD
jgi:hypothetical protein